MPSKFHLNNSVSRRCSCGLAALILLACQAQAQYDPDWTRNFRVGVLVGFNIKTEFSMGNVNFGGNGPGPDGVAGEEHFYDNGYVRVDQTGNAQGQTAFWGYNDASQYDALAQTLTFTGTTGFRTAPGAGSVSKDESPFLGFDMAYGGCIWRWDRLRVGWELGFGLLPIKASDNRRLPVNARQVTHSFDVGPIVMPTAPYQADREAGGGGHSTIGDIATLVGEDFSVAGTNSGSRTLDVVVYAVRLGPTLFWDATDRIGLQVGAGPALGFISGDYEFNDVIQTPSGTARNRGSIGMSDVVFGGFVNATVTFHAVANGDIYVSAQYMPLGTSSVRRGGREARLDLQGSIYVAAGVNWPF